MSSFQTESLLSHECRSLETRMLIRKAVSPTYSKRS